MKVEPWASPRESVLARPGTWRMQLPSGPVLELHVRQVGIRPDCLIVELEPIPGREEIAGWKGATLSVRRSAFPGLPPDEYYWSDLVGLAVVDRDGHPLGTVQRVEDLGADPLLRVADRLLIPFIEPYVLSVDLAGRRIVVDWQPDWS